MATLLLSAVGTALGGPIGGALGALAGRQVDMGLIGGGSSSGPRLKDLSVQTSSYGAPLPLHFGRIRAAGTVIWSTELIERREKQGGGKGRPSTTTYAYSASFAVALASRPIAGIGRIWADGNLLRGAAGDLKVAGTLRVHHGHGDQAVDPLIAQVEGGSACPAFRHTAYLVFEDLDLTDFGNRLPSLTFEVLADESGTSLAQIVQTIAPAARFAGPARGLGGFSIDRGTVADTLGTLDAAFPLAWSVWGESLVLRDGEPLHHQAAPLLPLPAALGDQGEAGHQTGISTRRSAQPRARSSGLRYYDLDRDYQPGLQRSRGRAEPGELQVLELPAALTARDARALADAASRRSVRAAETVVYRTAVVDHRFAPGATVQVPGASGLWRVDQWEWQAEGVALQLSRLPSPTLHSSADADPGRLNIPPDLLASPTALFACELPWDGVRSADAPSIWAASSAKSAGWQGASLFVTRAGGSLVPLGATGRRRALIGTTLNALPAASPLVFDRQASLDIELVAADLTLADADFAQLATGANRALVGRELVQFASAVPLGAGKWRLSHFLRGRGGTEGEVATHQAAEPFILLDDALIALDQQALGDAATATLAATGLADSTPVLAPVLNAGIGQRPLSPVHAKLQRGADGSVLVTWIRRARGAWTWPNEVEIPLNEQAEEWDVQLRAQGRTLFSVRTSSASVQIPGADLAAASGDAVLEIRQIGSLARSPALHVRLSR